MMLVQIAPFVSIALNCISAAVYGFYGDWRHAIYWTAAAVLTTSITI